jgi:nitrate/TMAO reductase-like tetraheme cytochrome c subunit
MSTRAHIKLRILVLGGLAGLVALGGAGAARYTSQSTFCGSCHEMKAAHTGWAKGVHARTHCFECHVDQGLVAHAVAKANGLRQVLVHLAGKVDMERVTAEVPSRRCVRCHDMGNREKLGERLVTAHLKHREAKLECLVCHSPSGHSREAFSGFIQDSCKECHSAKPQEVPSPYLKRPACTRPDGGATAEGGNGVPLIGASDGALEPRR